MRFLRWLLRGSQETVSEPCPHCGADITLRIARDRQSAEPMHRACLCVVSATEWRALEDRAIDGANDIRAW